LTLNAFVQPGNVHLNAAVYYRLRQSEDFE
jgi:hypothetical protein